MEAMMNGADVGSLPDLYDARGAATKAQPAGSLQWLALDRPNGSAMANDAA